VSVAPHIDRIELAALACGMELFAAAGIQLPAQEKGPTRAKRAHAATLRTPLFAYKVVDDAIGRSLFEPDEDMSKTAREYARKVKGVKAAKETTFRPVFIDEVLIKILGYRRIDPDEPYTLADEHTLGFGLSRHCSRQLRLLARGEECHRAVRAEGS